MTFEDLRAAGLKVALARELMDRFQLGGDIYNSLVRAALLQRASVRQLTKAVGSGKNADDNPSKN